MSLNLILVTTVVPFKPSLEVGCTFVKMNVNSKFGSFLLSDNLAVWETIALGFKSISYI